MSQAQLNALPLQKKIVNSMSCHDGFNYLINLLVDYFLFFLRKLLVD